MIILTQKLGKVYIKLAGTDQCKENVKNILDNFSEYLNNPHENSDYIAKMVGTALEGLAKRGYIYGFYSTPGNPCFHSHFKDEISKYADFKNQKKMSTLTISSLEKLDDRLNRVNEVSEPGKQTRPIDYINEIFKQIVEDTIKKQYSLEEYDLAKFIKEEL